VHNTLQDCFRRSFTWLSFAQLQEQVDRISSAIIHSVFDEYDTIKWGNNPVNQENYTVYKRKNLQDQDVYTISKVIYEYDN